MKSIQLQRVPTLDHKCLIPAFAGMTCLRGELSVNNESFAFNGTSRCAYDALQKAASQMKLVRRNPDCATLWSFRVS